MKRLVVAIAIAMEMTMAPALGEDTSLRRAFMRCIAQAVELGTLSDMLVLADPRGTRSATLVCSGEAAGKLFSAMDGISSQTIYGEIVIRSSGLGVQCMKPPTENGNCVVNIQTGTPFLDALRHQ
jgi:hypothetical protein